MTKFGQELVTGPPYGAEDERMASVVSLVFVFVSRPWLPIRAVRLSLEQVTQQLPAPTHWWHAELHGVPDQARQGFPFHSGQDAEDAFYANHARA